MYSPVYAWTCLFKPYNQLACSLVDPCQLRSAYSGDISTSAYCYVSTPDSTYSWLPYLISLIIFTLWEDSPHCCIYFPRQVLPKVAFQLEDCLSLNVVLMTWNEINPQTAMGSWSYLMYNNYMNTWIRLLCHEELIQMYAKKRCVNNMD